MAAVVPTTALPRLLHHRRRHYVRDRRSCQTTEQVLPRGARSGIRDFLWYYTRDATTKKWVPVSRRSIDVTRTFLAHSSLLNRRCIRGSQLREVPVSVSVDQEQLFPEDKDFGVNLDLSKMTCRKVSCPQPISKFSGILLLSLILLTEVSVNHMNLGHADRVSL